MNIEKINRKMQLLVENSNQTNINENFWNWFGNSKVVDSSGNPLVCYHGTPNGNFVEFQPKNGHNSKSTQQLDLGLHFTVDMDYAKQYASGKKLSKIFEVFLKIENPIYTNTMFYREDDEYLFSKYLNFMFKANILKKGKLDGSYFYNKQGYKFENIQNVMVVSTRLDEIPSSSLYNLLLEFEFDGIIYEPYNLVGTQHINRHPKSYVVLFPNQIKATNNDGTWNSNNNNIYS